MIICCWYLVKQAIGSVQQRQPRIRGLRTQNANATNSLHSFKTNYVKRNVHTR